MRCSEWIIKYAEKANSDKFTPLTSASGNHTSGMVYILEVAISALKIDSGKATMAIPVRITDNAVRFSDSNSWIWLMPRISVWVLMMCLVSII